LEEIMLTVISNLRQICERCNHGEPLEEDLASWLADSLDRFLRHECTSVDDAMGLRQPRGGVPWWLVEALYRRDRALRELADKLAADGSLSMRAREVRQKTVRYAATAWRFDKDRESMPPSYRGTFREHLWNAFKSGAPMPLGERQLRNILGP
jgi:hypothetical protein